MVTLCSSQSDTRCKLCPELCTFSDHLSVLFLFLTPRESGFLFSHGSSCEDLLSKPCRLFLQSLPKFCYMLQITYLGRRKKSSNVFRESLKIRQVSCLPKNRCSSAPRFLLCTALYLSACRDQLYISCTLACYCSGFLQHFICSIYINPLLYIIISY